MKQNILKYKKNNTNKVDNEYSMLRKNSQYNV